MKTQNYMLNRHRCNERKCDLRNIQFLLRYSDKITKVDTIAEHEKVLNSQGNVWMGKFGVGMSKRLFNIAEQQLKSGNDLYLYLMKGSNYTHKAKVTDILMGKDSRVEISSKNKAHTPSYYREQRCTIWFELSSIEAIDEGELEHLWLFNAPNSHPSKGGMRGLIYLTYRVGIEIKKKPINDNPLYTSGLFD